MQGPDAKLIVILNPTAGAGEGQRVAPEIARELGRRGLPYRIVQSEGRGHALQLARSAATAGARVIVAAGGDGTIHDVANGILSCGAAGTTALGVIPIGRGNDFVKVVQGTTPRSRAYDTLAHGCTRRVDVGRVEWDGGGEWFVNAMGTGIDVEVVRQIERGRNLPGGMVYIVGLVKALARYRPLRFRLSVDGQTSERRVMLVAVANGVSVGGSFRVCPAAAPDDGLLDVCIVDELSTWGTLLTASRILRGTHGRLKGVELRRASAVSIRSTPGTPLFFQVDGELREPSDLMSLRVSVAPGALRVVSHPAAEATPPANGTALSTQTQ